jgi:hypothetical protein
MPLLSSRARNHSAQRSPEQVQCLSINCVPYSALCGPVCTLAIVQAQSSSAGHAQGEPTRICIDPLPREAAALQEAVSDAVHDAMQGAVDKVRRRLGASHQRCRCMSPVCVTASTAAVLKECHGRAPQLHRKALWHSVVCFRRLGQGVWFACWQHLNTDRNCTVCPAVRGGMATLVLCMGTGATPAPHCTRGAGGSGRGGGDAAGRGAGRGRRPAALRRARQRAHAARDHWRHHVLARHLEPVASRPCAALPNSLRLPCQCLCDAPPGI